MQVDVTALAQVHPGAAGELCPWRSGAAKSSRTLCTAFRLSARGEVVAPSSAYGGGPHSFRIYLTPGDDHLTVTIKGRRDAGGTVTLTGHRAKGPCGGWIYDPVKLTASGAPVIGKQ